MTSKAIIASEIWIDSSRMHRMTWNSSRHKIAIIWRKNRSDKRKRKLNQKQTNSLQRNRLNNQLIIFKRLNIAQKLRKKLQSSQPESKNETIKSTKKKKRKILLSQKGNNNKNKKNQKRREKCSSSSRTIRSYMIRLRKRESNFRRQPKRVMGMLKFLCAQQTMWKLAMSFSSWQIHIKRANCFSLRLSLKVIEIL